MPGTFSTDLVTLNASDAVTGWTSLGDFSVPPSTDPSVKVQGTNALLGSGPAVGGNTSGFRCDFTARDVTAGEHFYPWVLMTSLSGAEIKANSGIGVSCGDSNGALTGTYPNDGPNNSKIFNVDGSDTNKYSGWQPYCFDPNGVADTVIGTTPTLTTISDVCILLRSTIAIADVTFNFTVDALRAGTGITVINGTALAPVEMIDVIAYDGAAANTFGVIITRGGIFEQNGKFNIGTAAQVAITVFKDQGKTLNFSDNPVAVGFHEIIVVGASGFISTGTFGDFTAGLASGGWTIQGIGGARWKATAGAFGALEFYACSLVRLEESALNNLSEIRNCNIIEGLKIITVGCLIEDTIFISGAATNAIEIASPTEMLAVKNCSFIGQTNAILITVAGTYSVDGNLFSNNTFDIENSSSGLVTINPINGANPVTCTNTGGGTCVINSGTTFAVTVKNEAANALINVGIRFEETNGADIDSGFTNASGKYSYSDTGINRTINIVARKRGYRSQKFPVTFIADFDIPITMVKDSTVNIL